MTTRSTMPADAKTPEGFSVRRWSRRKLEATRNAAPNEPPAPAVAGTSPQPSVATPAGVPLAPAPPAEATLPPVESLTAESDFAAFMQPKVDERLKRLALKKLFADPHFNVMDGLDVYIDDYTKPDPIPPDVLERLAQSGFVRGLGLEPVEGPPPAASERSVEPSSEAGPIAEEARAAPPEPAAVPPSAGSAPGATPKAGTDPAAGADAPDPPPTR